MRSVSSILKPVLQALEARCMMSAASPSSPHLKYPEIVVTATPGAREGAEAGAQYTKIVALLPARSADYVRAVLWGTSPSCGLGYQRGI
ncbi:hypothetical protein FIBSPDRAFT_851877, partial [Athelia psychrophila]